MPAGTRRYYRGHDLVAMRDVANAQTRYYHFDHQGTTQCLTDETGAATDRFASDAWGVPVKRTGSSINRQWYIGGGGYRTDASNNANYVRARWYAPPFARWMSKDPMEAFAPSEYCYVQNRVSFLIDPAGLFTIYPRCNGKAYVLCIDPDDEARHSARKVAVWKNQQQRIAARMTRIKAQEALELCNGVISIDKDCAIINAAWFDAGGAGATNVIVGESWLGCGEQGKLTNPHADINQSVDLPKVKDFVSGKSLTQKNCPTNLRGSTARPGANIAFRRKGRWCFLIVGDENLTPKETCKCLFELSWEDSGCGVGLSGKSAIQLDGGSSAKLAISEARRVRFLVGPGRSVTSYIVICGTKHFETACCDPLPVG